MGLFLCLSGVSFVQYCQKKLLSKAGGGGAGEGGGVMDIFGSVDTNPLNRSDRYDISQEVNPQRIQFAINILA